jgi:ankyrin repeat protein
LYPQAISLNVGTAAKNQMHILGKPVMKINTVYILVCFVSLVSGIQAAESLINPDYAAILRIGDVHKLRNALDRGASVNARDAAGNTPLILTAQYGNLSCLRLLLARGANANATNAAGATALHRAAFDYEKVRTLIAHGADVNKGSGLGNSALMLAARPANSFRTVELLLANGANAKATNHFGATALMAAVAGGDVKSVRLLIRHGADVNAQAAANEMGFILGGGRSPLMWAAFRGNVSLLKLLIEAGADVNGVGGLGNPLAQAAWGEYTAAAEVLIEHGARVNQAGPMDGYAPLHWAASTERQDTDLMKLLLSHGADPNLGGGENVNAFLGTPQTPLMLARRRGDTPVVAALSAAGATNATPDRVRSVLPYARESSEQIDNAVLLEALAEAVQPLQETSVKSKQSFIQHASKQNCTSCHQQYLPMAAIGLARKKNVPVNNDMEQQLIEMVRGGELNTIEPDWQALFHPDAVHTKGYELFAFASQDLPADANSDAWVHHLAAIQGQDGQWYNNLPRPPIQTGDISATALAIHALQRYPLPGRQAEFSKKVDRARRWLWIQKPENNEDRIYQILGLAWAGEPTAKLQSLAKALLAEQSSDGGWSQLPGLKPDAYATGQAVYALRIGVNLTSSHPHVQRGIRYLLKNQLADGTWHVRRRAFPFQPTMDSGFPHGRDSWISAAATSWAVMALSLPEDDSKSFAKR